MNAGQITQALYQHFANYEYKLNNTFVFSWESDFFCQSKSGYFVECEIKVSRSDFFRDFEKEKHELFKSLLLKKKFHITHQPIFDYRDREAALICRVEIPYMETDYGPAPDGKKRNWREKSMISRRPDWRYVYDRFDYSNGKYVVNDYGNITIRKRYQDIYAQATAIQIRPIEEYKVPNQFYYVVPVGLIDLHELPPYAGLIYVTTNNEVALIKKAPYLHKQKMDLDRILLKKYYNLWQYKVPYETKLQIRKDYSETIN